MKKNINPQTSDELNNESTDIQEDDFDRLLSEFVNSPVISAIENDDDLDSDENLDDDDDENDGLITPADTLTSLLPSQGSTELRSVMGKKHILPVRHPKAYYDGIRVGLEVNCVEMLCGDKKPIIDTLEGKCVSVTIDFSESADEQHAIGFALYHEDSPEPLQRQTVTAKYDSVNWLFQAKAKASGLYFIVVENVDLSFIHKDVRQRGSYAIIPFAVMQKNTRANLAKIKAAKLAPLRDRYAELLLQLDCEVDRTKVQLHAECWDADTYTRVAKCTNANARAFKLQPLQYGAWIDGEYMIWLYLNHTPWQLLRMTIADGAPCITAIEPLRRNPRLRTLASLTAPDPCGSEYGQELSCLPGNAQLKEWVAAKCQMRKLMRQRTETYGMRELRLPRVYVVYGDCGEEHSTMLRTVARLMLDSSSDVIDCSRLRTAHEQNMAMDNEKIDMDSALSLTYANILTNVSSLAQSEMAAQAGALRRKIGELVCDGSLFILGSRGEVSQMLEFLPWLREWILPEHTVELTPLSRRDIAREAIKVMNKMDMRCTPQVLDAIMQATAAMPSVAGWSLGKIYEWVQNSVAPRFAQRLCRKADVHSSPAALRRPELRMVERSDLDLSAFAGTEQGFDQCMHELSQLVGLGQLKGALADLFKLARFREERRRMGLGCGPQARYHCILTGNPGTGKTTVAKLLGKVLKSLGIISKGGVIVADRKRLIGQYIGETEYNMRMLLKEAAGNVLFVDEAYTLVGDPNDKKDFGPKALEALLTITAQPDPDMVVVFAGYEKEMQNLFAINSGIDSRFPLRFNFADYTVDELAQIGHNLLQQRGYVLTPEAEAEMTCVIERAVAAKTRSFGNARWVDDLISLGIEVSMASRLAAEGWCDREALTTVQAQDVRDGYQRLCPQQKPKRALGFK